MEIHDGNRTIHIEGWVSLDPDTDNAFRALFTAFFRDPRADFQALVGQHLPSFEPAMLAFFDNNAQSNPLQDRFFTNLTIIWKFYLDEGRLSEAKAFWNWVVSTTITWEERTGLRVHKGSALYFWAVTAIIQGEIDKGFLLMHAAVEEDILTQNTPLPRTPALMFAMLDFSEPRQFFYGFVKQLADFLAQFLASYQALAASQMTLSDVQTKFLYHPPSAHAVFSLTHCLARLHLLERLPRYSLSSQFAGQYELGILSDFALVIDEALAFIDNAHWRFVDLAAFLSTRANLQLSRDDLTFANISKDASFDRTMTELIDGVFRFRDGNTRTRLECDLAISYCIRNHGAHNLSSFPTISSRFVELRKSFLNVLFLTIDVLY